MLADSGSFIYIPSRVLRTRPHARTRLGGAMRGTNMLSSPARAALYGSTRSETRRLRDGSPSGPPGPEGQSRGCGRAHMPRSGGLRRWCQLLPCSCFSPLGVGPPWPTKAKRPTPLPKTHRCGDGEARSLWHLGRAPRLAPARTILTGPHATGARGLSPTLPP